MKPLRDFVSLFIRNLPQSRWFTVLNGVSLAFGLALGLLVVFYAKYEWSYDRNYNLSGQIYRLTGHGYIGSDSLHTASTPVPSISLMDDLSIYLENATQVVLGENKLVKFGGKSFAEHRFIYADTSFFSVFDVPFISGDVKTALNDPSSVVVSHQTALRYFGYENPMGKVIELDNGLKLTVTGVCEETAANTHLHFDFVAAITAIDRLYLAKADSAMLEKWRHNWLNFNSYNYVVLKPGVAPSEFDKQFSKLAAALIQSQVRDVTPHGDSTYKSASFNFVLQDIRDIHLNSNLENELEPNANQSHVKLAIGLAILILLITSINFVNLTTSHVQRRLHEAKVRKMAGASHMRLFRQFMGESFANTLVAFFMALVIVELLFPFFNSYLNLGMKISQVRRWSDLLVALVAALAVGGLTGLLPALFYSKEHNDSGGDYAPKKRNAGFYWRAGLVCLQVTASVVMVLLTLGIWKQIATLRTVNLGYNPKNLLVIERGYALGDSLSQFRDSLLKKTSVEEMTTSSHIPGDQLSVIAFQRADTVTNQMLLWNVIIVDDNFGAALQIPVRKGSFFNSGDTGVICVNQALIDDMQTKLDTSSTFRMFGKNATPYHVKGVLGDFYFQNLKTPVAPMALLPQMDHFKYVLLRFKQGQQDSATACAANLWAKFTNNQPFDTFLLTDRINGLYEEERRLGRLSLILALFSILMGGLSVIGISVFYMCICKSEITVRRQQGASHYQLTIWGVTRLAPYVFGGALAAVPIAWVLLKGWLDPFLVQNHLTLLNYLVITFGVALYSFALMYLQFKNILGKLID